MSSSLEAASLMPGVSPAYQRLAYLIAKCCDLARLLSPDSTDLLEKAVEPGEDGRTPNHQLLEEYCKLPTPDRRPEELPEDIKSQIALFCAEDLYPTTIIMHSFGDWVGLLQGLEEFEYLGETCDPRKAASFAQLADQVYGALGFRQEERRIGLVAARQEIAGALQRLDAMSLRDAWGLSSPLFNDVEEVLTHLVSFYWRVLRGAEHDYRHQVLEVLEESGTRTYNYRKERMQFGNKIDVLVHVDQYISDTMLQEFQDKFGQSREGIIDRQKWEPVLRRLAIIRGATAHPEVVLDRADLQEIRSILTGVEDRHFTDDRLESHLNVDQNRVIRFSLHQIRSLLKHALDDLSGFYRHLGEKSIFPEVQFHDRLEIGRDGIARLLYTDEEARAVQFSLEQRRNFENVFYPGQYVFFKHLQTGEPIWLPVAEKTFKQKG